VTDSDHSFPRGVVKGSAALQWFKRQGIAVFGYNTTTISAQGRCRPRQHGSQVGGLIAGVERAQSRGLLLQLVSQVRNRELGMIRRTSGHDRKGERQARTAFEKCGHGCWFGVDRITRHMAQQKRARVLFSKRPKPNEGGASHP
jgi:hypothetical protein